MTDGSPALFFPRPRVLVSGLLTAIMAAGGAVAGTAVLRQADGGVAIDGQALRASYRGHLLNTGQVEVLDHAHRHLTSVTNRETACHGVSLLFDDDAQADRYTSDFERRSRTAQAADPAGSPASDPCIDWRGPLPSS